MGKNESLPNPKLRRRPHSRREFLWNTGARFPMLALIDLLSRDGFFQSPAHAASAKTGPRAKGLLAARKPHFPAKAKHVVFLFMNGAPSQVDTFDPKPALTKYNGTPYQGDAVVGSNNRPIGHLMQSPFEFTRHGRSGLEISSLFPNTAKHADDLCVIRSLQTDTAAHASGCIQMNTGSVVIGKPSLGSWLSYGLGTESEDLPSFVVMTDPRGGPIGSASNWSSGFMPAAYQGTLFRSGGSPLLNLETPEGVSERTQRHSLDLLKGLNETHQRRHAGDSELEARIHSYELAYRMQTTAADAVDLDAESRKTREMYGLHNELTEDFGRKCLITRRLIERGMRFVQLYSGGGHIEDTWDGHLDCISNHTLHAGRNRPADRRADNGFEAYGSMGRDSAGMGRRVRPHAYERGCGQARPRSQLARLQYVACRRRRERRPSDRRDGRAGLPRPSRTHGMFPTCTQQSCI